MQHRCQLPFHGDAAKAFDLAASSLTAIGFRIVSKSQSSLDATGPGMCSSRQSPLLGASRIWIEHGRDQLSLEADLGGVRRLAQFVRVFPVALCLGIGVLLAAVFSIAFGRLGFPVGPWLIPLGMVIGANVLVWAFIGPFMIRRFEARTRQSLEALLGNMAVVGEGGLTPNS